MCLAIPARVIHIQDNWGKADFGGVMRKVRLDLLEDVKEGDYVLVHVGFAIEKIDEEEAMEFYRIWSGYGDR
ncbi:MAG: HypC/HybG/HupF family hydrogenase formation chaperone [Candidatus Syntropharchaeia archaeon]